MRYVLFNWLSPEDFAAWEGWTEEQQQADVQRHMEWFGRHRDHIVGGEELDEPRTVKTLLNRLINKGALAYEARGKHYLYRPKVTREQCVREETRSFLSRVFGNAPELSEISADFRLPLVDTIPAGTRVVVEAVVQDDQNFAVARADTVTVIP